jgi:hypothetical protein
MHSSAERVLRASWRVLRRPFFGFLCFSFVNHELVFETKLPFEAVPGRSRALAASGGFITSSWADLSRFQTKHVWSTYLNKYGNCYG